VNSATSDGCAANDDVKLIEGYPQKPIFQSIDESSAGKSWSVYFEMAPTTLFFKYTRRAEHDKKFHEMKQFWEDVANGTLANYVWLEPNYSEEGPNRPANDQHPDHDVSLGDALMKQVYEALRNSPLWNETLLIITYDEHGGFFDHVPPPTDCPNPDGKIAYDTNPPFDFTRLGVRVPALMISPWIPAGTVVGEPASTHYEHSSIPATIRKWFAPDQAFLTERDAYAATFDSVVDMLDEPRTDCPTTLPSAPTHRDFPGNGLPTVEKMGTQRVTGFVQSLVKMCSVLVDGEITVTGENMTEAEASRHCRQKMAEYFSRGDASVIQS